MTHTGNLDRIKAIITLHGPQTAPDLVKATGLTDTVIRGALTAALSRTGGIVYAGKRGGMRLYGLPGIHTPKAKEYPKPYVHPFTPLSRDPFEHRDLALMGR